MHLVLTLVYMSTILGRLPFYEIICEDFFNKCVLLGDGRDISRHFES